MSDAIIGSGITYEIEDGSAAFDLMGEVHDITPPNQQADEVEVTHYGSTGGVREYIPGLTEPGEATFAINWVPSDATDVIIQALKTSGAVRPQRITWPNGVIWTFDGFIKGFEPTAPIDDRLTATVTVKVSGATTIT